MQIGIIGDDRRQCELLSLLKDNGYNAVMWDFENSDTVVLPLPLTRDGIFLNSKREIKLSEIMEKCRGKNVIYGSPPSDFAEGVSAYALKTFDYNKNESFLYGNARLTAEAGVALAISSIGFSLYGAKIAILGFGRIGKLLCKYLSAFNARITVLARREESCAYAEALGAEAFLLKDGEDLSELSDTELLFNTVPARVLTGKWANVFENATVVDLALKGSIDVAKFKNIISGPALPGKYFAKNSAKILFDSIRQYLE